MKKPPRRSRRRRIVLRIRVLMAERDIRTVAELQRRLDALGIPVSNAQLSRIVDNKARRLNMDVLNGVMHIFKCQPSDLFALE